MQLEAHFLAILFLRVSSFVIAPESSSCVTNRMLSQDAYRGISFLVLVTDNKGIRVIGLSWDLPAS